MYCRSISIILHCILAAISKIRIIRKTQFYSVFFFSKPKSKEAKKAPKTSSNNSIKIVPKKRKIEVEELASEKNPEIDSGAFLLNFA